MSLLRVENLHVHYGSIHAIKDISFEVNEGEIVTLIGANGAGKSTALNTVSGLMLQLPAAGSFRSTAISPAHRRIKSSRRGWPSCPEGRRYFPGDDVFRKIWRWELIPVRHSEIADSIEGVYDRFPRLKERYKQVARARCPAVSSRCWRWDAL